MSQRKEGQQCLVLRGAVHVVPQSLLPEKHRWWLLGATIFWFDVQTLRERQTMENLLQTERDDRHAESWEAMRGHQRVKSDLDAVANLREQKLQMLTTTVCPGSLYFSRHTSRPISSSGQNGTLGQ
jgi:hypothetical protein